MTGVSAPFKLLLFPLLCQMEAVLGVRSVGLVAVHKSIIASLHQQCVQSPFERVKTIQRICARDEGISPCTRRNRDSKSNSKDNRIDAKFLHTLRERVGGRLGVVWGS